MPSLDEVAYITDFGDPLSQTNFVEDFCGWLHEQERDVDAYDFRLLIKDYEREAGDDYDTEDVIELAKGFAPIVDITDELAGGRSASDIALKILEEQEEDDRQLPWDQEAALINQALTDSAPSGPRSLYEAEFPKVEIYYDLEKSVLENFIVIPQLLVEYEYYAGARSFCRDLQALMRHTPTGYALLQLAWSYVSIYPDPDQFGIDDWYDPEDE